jgi:threonylcarbamoyladenosine tRNA methylthiotransferase MtaB
MTELVTFGCRLNAAESETIATLAGDLAGDTVIVNTCAVTAEAERQARQAIRRLKRDRPDATIVVTGCAAQIDPAKFAAMPEVSRVVGNIEKLKPETWLTPVNEKIAVADIMQTTEMIAHPPAFAEHTRAFVEVQQGCDHRCTFCVIPYGRGNSRSAPLGDVVKQIGQFAHTAHPHGAEVVLTGVDLTSWGHDLPGAPSFTGLVRRILKNVPMLQRLRLSSLDPAEIDDELLELFANEPRLMPHLHLSLQAGDDLILKRMKRRHSRAEALDVMKRARQARPDLTLGADLIAGFPTEDEAMFERTRAIVDEAGLDLVHVFPFSPRVGTPAARMPLLDRAIVRERAARLRDTANAAKQRFLARHVGTNARVLIEKSGTAGYSEHFAAVTLDQPHSPGAIVPVTITGIADDRLIATPIHHPSRLTSAA